MSEAPSSALQLRRYRVAGKVQGVFFRASTRQQALQLGLTGYAKNLTDGSVEVMACGPAAQLEQLVAWLWQGPPSARVTQVELLEVGQADAALSDFMTR